MRFIAIIFTAFNSQKIFKSALFMPILMKKPISISTHWIAILASIFTPVFGFLSAADTFLNQNKSYFGLKLSSVIAYTFSLIVASLLTLLFSIFTLISVRRSIAIALSAGLALALGNVLGMVAPHAGTVTEAHSGILDDYLFPYSLIGSLSGMLIGFGNGALVANLVKADSRGWSTVILATIALTPTLVSGVMSVLQKFELALICVGLGIIIQLSARYLD